MCVAPDDSRSVAISATTAAVIPIAMAADTVAGVLVLIIVIIVLYFFLLD